MFQQALDKDTVKLSDLLSNVRLIKFLDRLTSLSSNIFSSKDSEIMTRIQNLRKLSTAAFFTKPEILQSFIPLIQTFSAEIIRSENEHFLSEVILLLVISCCYFSNV